VITVEADLDAVEERLRSGRLACPDCAGVLSGWGRARGRWVRVDGQDPRRRVRVVPRRSRCGGCGTTHVLLPVLLLARRADTAGVVGAALAGKAAGVGHRRIAAGLGRPAETVRGWLRRFASRLEPVRVVFTRWCRAVAPDPVLPEPAGSAWADALAAVTACAAAIGARFAPRFAPRFASDTGAAPGAGVVGAPVGEVPIWAAVWEVAAAVSHGRLLAPGWPVPDTRC
jgi:hypothetical protein